jgi:molecular chaperone DnaK
VIVHLLQGEREMAADNDSIARLHIGPLAPAPRGVPQIEVQIVSDGGGLPRATARDTTTDEAIAVRVRPSGGLTEAEIVALAAIHAGAPSPASASADDGFGGAAAAGAVDLEIGAASNEAPRLVDPNDQPG